MLCFLMLKNHFSIIVFLELALESNPSDHARASTIFLCKSQTDGELMLTYTTKHVTYVDGCI